jgi:DNA (cytosine-5)-methyltransferase 1
VEIIVLSFFSGLGLLDLGFENACLGNNKFNISFVNEHNSHFLEAYKYARKNNNHKPQYGFSDSDIRDFLNNEKWNECFPDFNDVKEKKIVGFIGGPPCPDFSVAGKNAGGLGINGSLTTSYVKLIERRKPTFFVLENVKGLYKTKKHRQYYEKIKRRLYRAGYTLFDSIENAIEYGTPQYRERLILVGFSRNYFGKRLHFDFGNHKLYNLGEILDCDWPLTSEFHVNGNLNMPEDIIEELTVQHWFDLNDVLNHPNCADCFQAKAIKKFNTISEGDVTGKSFKRIHRWRYAPTAAYGNNEVHLHPYKLRRISVAEALAVQSLPANFVVKPELSLTDKFKMVGNGVPYLLSLGIANDILDWIVDYGEQDNRG